MSLALTTGTQRIPTRLGALRVETIGEGPPAVLWHSMFVDSTSWQRVVPALSSRRTPVVVDGPSSGGSDPLARISSIAECTAAAVELLAGLGVAGPVDWVGNAWGGHVGIQR